MTVRTPNLADVLFRRLRTEVLGLHVPQVTADGSARARVYLDSAATTLMLAPVWRVTQTYLETAEANAHNETALVGRATSAAIAAARANVGALLGADAGDAVVFAGCGTTGAANLLARLLLRGAPATRARPLAVVTGLEHHSNMLPWAQAAGEGNVRLVPARADGTLDVDALADLLRREGARVAVVAVTAVSNVTGVINPVHDVARLAHAAGAVVVVDAAQALAHHPLAMHPADAAARLDYVVASGHKAYAPGSPGVLVGPRAALSGVGWDAGPVGGGTVEWVGAPDAVTLLPGPERLEAGTPDIPGIVALGAAARLLAVVGYDRLVALDRALLAHALDGLRAVPGVVVYGPTDPALRTGVVAFNVHGLPFGLVAAALDDWCAVVTRGDCFCAQPYVRGLLDETCTTGYCEPPSGGRRGMVRASFGLYTTPTDVATFVAAVAWVAQNARALAARYTLRDGAWHCAGFQPPLPFVLDAAVDAALSVR